LENLGRRKTLLPEVTDGQRVVALGQAEAVFVYQEARVEVVRSGEVEDALQEDLAGGGFEKVAAADYFGDLCIGVVDDAGELIAG
jgi:hypothetical protein